VKGRPEKPLSGAPVEAKFSHNVGLIITLFMRAPYFLALSPLNLLFCVVLFLLLACFTRPSRHVH